MSYLTELGFKVNTKDLVLAQKQLDRTTAAGGRLDTQSQKTSKSLGLVGAAITALGVTASARQIIQYADTWDNLNTQLRQVTGSEKDLIATRKDLLAISKEARIDLSATVGLYSELTRGTADLNLTSNDLLGVTKTLNNLFLAGGKPLSEMTGAIRQLNQGFASGVLRGDEFNSVAEGAPRIMDALTASLGKTRGELREFAATGGITSAIMVEALKDYEQTASKLASTVKVTFEQNLGVATTNMTAFVGESELLTDSVDILGSSIVKLSENLEPLTYVLGAAGGVVAVILAAKVATLGLSAAMGILNAVMLANPIALVVGSVAAFAGAIYAARNVTVDYGGETVKILDLVQSGFATVGDGFNAVADLAISAYDSITGLFGGVAENAASTVNSLVSNFSASFGNIYDMAKSLVNGVIGTFVTLGKSIGIIAAHMTESFSNAFTNITRLGSAAWKDLTAALSGNLGASNITKALENALYTPVSKIFSDISKEAEQAFNVDYIGGAASGLGNAVDFVTSKFDAYVLSISSARKEAKAMADEQAELNSVLDEIFGKSSSNALEKLPKVTEDLAQDLSGLTEEIDNFGGAWTRTGNIVVDTFGNMADAMKDYSSRMEDLNKLQEKVNKKRKESSADNVALDKLQMKINNERALAEIDGYQAAASAAAGAFSEKTVAARAFGAINQALAVAEIAMTYQKIAASSAETGATLADESLKQTAKGTTAILNQGTGDPYTAFARIAAMTAIVASLIGAVSGSSGGGGSTTGTTLGGDPSESLKNVNSSLEDIMIDQLSELRGLRSDLNSADNQAFALFKTLLNDTRDHDEITNPFERKLEDSFDALNGDRNSNADYVDQLRGVFDSVESILSESISTLGINTTGSLQTFLFDVGTISFDNLDADEAEKRLGEILSSQSDLMAQHLIPSITRFQQVGEGAFETLVRVTKEQVTFNDSIDQMGISLGDLSSTLQIDVAQSVIDLVGGFDNFTDFVSEFTDEFLTDTQKMDNLKGSLTDVFDSVGLSLSTTREGFYDLVSGIDVSTMQGQELLATLLEISPAMADYIGALEDLASDKLGLQIDLLDAQGESLQALTLSRQAELEATDESLRSLLEQVFAQEDLNAARDAEIEAAERLASLALDRTNLEVELLNLQGMTDQALLISRQLELDAADESLHALMMQIFAQEDLNAARENEINALDELRDTLQNNVLFAESELQRSLDSELSRFDLIISASQDAASQEIASIQSASQERLSALNSERSVIASVASQLGQLSKSVSATSALSSARSGNFEPAGRIGAGSFSSGESARIGAAREAFALDAIGKLADNALSDIDKTIASTESSASSQIAAIQQASDNEIAIIEKQSQALQNQVDAALGIDDSVMSIENALTLLSNEQQALADLDYDNQLLQIQAQYDTIEAINTASDSSRVLLAEIKNELIPLKEPNQDNEDVKAMVNEIKILRAELENSLSQVAVNTSNTAKAVKETNYIYSAP